MDIILETINLNKKFGKQTAVNGLSLQIERNSVYGLLGPNGAGKSTTLKMITGMLRPDSGSIRFDGHVWCRQDLNQIGALVETPPLYDNLTAEENLKVRTTMLGLPEFRIKEVLRTVDLTDTGKKRAGQFSLGIQELRELIRSFPAQGITVILSSHILSEVEQTADHIGIIAGGRLGYSGAVDHTEDLEALFMKVVRDTGKECA